MKKSKRIISLVLSILMIVTSLPLMAVNSFAKTSGDFEYDKFGPNTIEISAYTGTATEVVFPSELDGYKVEMISRTFKSNHPITSVVVPDTVTYAYFNNLEGLKKVTLGSNVRFYSFSGSNSLEEIIVSENNAKFSSLDGVLYNKDKTAMEEYPCARTKEYDIPTSVIDIKDYITAEVVKINGNINNIYSDSVKYILKGTKTLIIGDDVSDIPFMFLINSLENIIVSDGNPNYTFDNGNLFSKDKKVLIRAFNVAGMDNYIIPNGVVKIGDQAFMESDLAQVTFSDSVEEIGERAFGLCKSLKKITIPETIKKVRAEAFYACGIEEVTVNCEIDLHPVDFKACDNLKKAVIDADIMISPFAFLKGLETVEISPKVRKMRFDAAFAFDENLKRINVDENNPNFTSVDGIVFNKDKTALLACPASTEIGAEYIIPEGVKKIGDDAFKNVKTISKIVTPTTLNEIESHAFDNASIKEMVINGDHLRIHSWAIYSLNLDSLILNEGIERIDEDAFYTSLNCDLVLPKSLKYLGRHAFHINELKKFIVTQDWANEPNISNNPFDASVIDTVVFEKGVTKYCSSFNDGFEKCKIGELVIEGNTVFESGFSDTAVVKKVVYGKDVTQVDAYLFSVPTVTSIEVDENNALLTSVDGVLFDKEKKVLIGYPNGIENETYTIPDGTLAVNDYAFALNSKLKTVNFNDDLLAIGDYAFFKTNLDKVDFGDKLEFIGERAFSDCERLYSVELPKNIEEIGDYAFGYHHYVYEDGIVIKKDEFFEIQGERGSAAEDYALTYGLKFKYTWYPDVSCREWYYDAIRYNYENGYITGYSNGTFGPANNIQRQDFVLILARIAGADLSAYEGQNGGFSDVQTGSYYASAVAWAKDTGVANGFSADNFGVGTFISREQICIMLCRYLNGSVLGNADTILNAYPDGGNTSPWAKESVAWAVENGIIGNAGYINPIGNAGRAEVAQIIYNMANNEMI